MLQYQEQQNADKRLFLITASIQSIGDRTGTKLQNEALSVDAGTKPQNETPVTKPQ